MEKLCLRENLETQVYTINDVMKVGNSLHFLVKFVSVVQADTLASIYQNVTPFVFIR